ncbi:hypothetical protein GC176_09545 [bacterium]|nr:hypothetical protein [bacterium]
MQDVLSILMIGFFLGGAVVHVVLALAVWEDGTRLDRDGSPTFFVGPFFWAVMTLMCGLLVVLVYWLMHHSTLRREN